MRRKAQTDDFHFEGFDYPTTTPVPDVIFDSFLARLGEAELKSLLYIVRRTFGFKKDRDPISFNQFQRGITTRDGRVLDQGCGIRDRTTLSRALQSLEEKGIIRSEKGTDARGENVTTVYSLRFKAEDAPVVSPPSPESEVVGNSYHPGLNHPQGVVGNSYHPGLDYPHEVVGNSYHGSGQSLLPVVGNSYPQQTVLQQTGGQDFSKFRRSELSTLIVDNSGDNAATPTSHSLPVPTTPPRNQIPPPHAEAISLTPVPMRDPVPFEMRAPSPTTAPTITMSVDTGTPPPAFDATRALLQRFIEDFGREFNDQASLRSSLSRLVNMQRRVAMPVADFIAHVYAARQVTQERTVAIRTRDGEGTKNKMVYFFAVLEHRLGLREYAFAEATAVAREAPDAASSHRPRRQTRKRDAKPP